MASTTVLIAAGAELPGPAGKAAGWPMHGVTAPGAHGRRGEVDEERIGMGQDPAGLFHGTFKYIDDRGGRIASDEASLEKLVLLFPPSCIFDGNGNVIHDSGARGLIDAVSFERAMDERAAVTKLTIRCNKPQPSPPVLSVVNCSGAHISVQPFGMFEWVFTLEFGSGSGMADLDSTNRRLYCVEIR